MGLVSIRRFSGSRNTMVKTAFQNSNPKCSKSPMVNLTMQREMCEISKGHNSSSNIARDLILVSISMFFGTPDKMAPSVLLYLYYLYMFSNPRKSGTCNYLTQMCTLRGSFDFDETSHSSFLHQTSPTKKK